MSKRFLTNNNIDSDSLCTPYEIRDPLFELWGGPPDCDPCSNEHSIMNARRTLTFGGLHFPWYGPNKKAGNVWENQPYSTNDPWVNKTIHEMDKAKNVKELVMLCMFASSTIWWRKMMVVTKRNPRVMATKRIKFLGPGGVPLPNTAQFDTALIYFGTKHAKFDKLFRHVENWTTWGR